MTAKIKNAARGRSHQNRHRPKGVSHRSFEKVYWPYLPIIAAISVLLVFGGQSGALASAALRHPGSRVLAYATGMSVSGLLADTNAARAANGVAALGLNSQLSAAAQAKANDMASRNYWSHNTPEGNPPWIFDDAQGYAYQKLGENLAAGFSDEQAAINGWMASPPHRENLLDPVFVDVGFGFANNPDYTSAGGGPMTIVVAHYGKPLNAAAPVAVTPPPAAPISQASPPPAAAAAPAPEAPPSGTDIATPAANKSSTAQEAKKAQPATTETSTKGITLSYKASRAQVAFAKLPASTFATGMATFAIFAVVGLWLSRHLLTLRRVLVMGESFVVHHPMVDVGLLVIAGLSFMLTQTAGFIQ
jgi:hypothetical protein